MPPKRTAKRKSAKREEPAVVKDADASHSEDDSPSSDESEESEEETKPVVRKVNAFALLGGDDDDDDDDESEEEESEEEEEKPVKAKSKPANPFAALGGDSDDDDDDESEEEEEKPVKAKSKPANPFAALGGDSDDDESESEEEEEEEDQKKAPVKTKPANPFAALGGDEDDDDDDSDNDKEEEEEEKKKKVVVEEEKEEVKKPLTAAEKRKLKKKQQQQKKKNKSAADDDMDEFERALAEAKATVGLKDDEPQAKEPETQTEPVATETEKTKEEETSTAPAPTPATSTAPAPTEDGDKSDGDEGDEASGTTEGGEAKPLSAAEKKKLKNKKKKEKEKEKAAAAAAAAAEAPKKKVPAFVERKKQEMEERARLMEELEAERARLIKEEEERQAREEEEERKLEEKRRLKREKEKARKEKLKAEGLLLSKAEREKRARAMAQYGDIAAAVDKEDGEGEPQKKKVVYGKRKKQTPQQVQEAKEAHERQVKEEQEAKEQAERDANEGEESEEDLLDSWDAELSDDEGGAGVKQAPEPSKASDASSTTTSSSGPKTSNKKGSAVDDAADALLGSLAEAERSKAGVNVQKGMTLRSPICCVLGHVDTGKTKLLDKIRRTNVQNGEAGGITQQIGASYFPGETIQKLTERMMGDPLDLRVPGLLIIDTPGHESFSNLRSRGTSMCDMSILVVDIVHGLEPQTIESIQLLKRTKTPFVVALNKIDRLYEWKVSKDGSSRESLKRQQKNTLIEFNERLAHVKTQFAEQGLNAELYYENQDMRKYVSLIPTSAHTGEGIPDLLTLIIDLTQKLLVERLRFRPDDVECTVLEVKRLEGLGMTVDVILAQGALREGDTVVMCSFDGPVVTQIKALLMPPPLRELRVKADYEKHKEITAAQGVKVLCRNIESVVAGTQLYVCRSNDLDEIERLKKMVVRQLEASLAALETQDRGVYVMASTLGALEALLEYLRTSKVPVAGVNIGPVHRKDVVKASTQLQHDAKYAVIMAFDVPVDRDARHMAEELGLRIFTADIIYHLTDDFTAYLDEMKLRRKEELRHIAYFPVRLRIIPEFIFNKRDPIVLGVDIIDGQLRRHTPILVPSQGNCDLGVVIGIERDHKEVEVARKGQSVCVKIEHPSDKKMFGRHFDEKDELVSKCTRESIDALKEAFRDDLTKEDWVLVKGLKKLYGI